jgi:hypothetical protein
MGIASGAFIAPSAGRAESPIAMSGHAPSPACGLDCELANGLPAAIVVVVLCVAAGRRLMRRPRAGPAGSESEASSPHI